MKLLIYADLHATDGSEVSFTSPGTTLQHMRAHKFFQDIAQIHAEHACEGTIDLGDTTSDRSSIPVPTIEVLGAGLALLPDSAWNIKLTGNHEQYLRSTSITNRKLFDHKFTVIDGCEVFDLDGKIAVFASYPASYEELEKWLKDTAAEYAGTPKILFGHFQVRGCEMNSGMSTQGISKDTLALYDLTLLGHVHKPQSLSKQAFYVGSPFQQNWGETDERKRVGILDTDSLTVTWVPLQGYPQYVTVSYADFCAQATDTAEDRWRVVLTSHEETEKFFAHPLFNRAEPVYEYSVETRKQETKETQQDWSVHGILKRWIAASPPAQAGIELSLEEMLDVGTDIAEG